MPTAKLNDGLANADAFEPLGGSIQTAPSFYRALGRLDDKAPLRGIYFNVKACAQGAQATQAASPVLWSRATVANQGHSSSLLPLADHKFGLLGAQPVGDTQLDSSYSRSCSRSCSRSYRCSDRA